MREDHALEDRISYLLEVEKIAKSLNDPTDPSEVSACLDRIHDAMYFSHKYNFFNIAGENNLKNFYTIVGDSIRSWYRENKDTCIQIEKYKRISDIDKAIYRLKDRRFRLIDKQEKILNAIPRRIKDDLSLDNLAQQIGDIRGEINYCFFMEKFLVHYRQQKNAHVSKGSLETVVFNGSSSQRAQILTWLEEGGEFVDSDVHTKDIVTLTLPDGRKIHRGDIVLKFSDGYDIIRESLA